VSLSRSAAPGITLKDEVRFLLYADYLVLLSPTGQGLQEQLNIIREYSNNWAINMNFQKTKVVIFLKKCQKSEQQKLLHHG
jgi:hypothetical protein